jgi:hypothetical protein
VSDAALTVLIPPGGVRGAGATDASIAARGG